MATKAKSADEAKEEVRKQAPPEAATEEASEKMTAPPNAKIVGGTFGGIHPPGQNTVWRRLPNGVEVPYEQAAQPKPEK